jgi:glycosyltransferase involved in cell wall biosynthesis
MSETPRKLLIAHYRPDVVSGAENSIADMVDQLDERFDVTMLVPGEGNLANFFRKRGMNVWVNNVETPRRLYPGLHSVQSLLLARQIRKRGYDAVLCNTIPAAGRVLTGTRLAHRPAIIYMRDYIANTPHHRKLLAQAQAILCISKDVQQHLKDIVDPARTWLAYNYINPEPIFTRHAAHQAAGVRLLPFAPEHPVVGLVGRITPYKQPDLFVRAVPLVLREVPQARFVVIGAAQGREKTYEESVRALAADLGVQEQVAFLGLRKDAVELTAEMTIACLTSGREPLGRVILEAHLLNVPVVVPDVGGPAEIVQNETTGLHFPSTGSDAPVQLARQIIRLLKDKALRECLSKQANHHVLSTFASRKHVQIQEEYIDQICASYDGG